MDNKTYRPLALRTLNSPTQLIFSEHMNTDVLHGAMGIVTEAGELLDAVKKALIYGKPLDRTNVLEEIGDVMWYINTVCHGLGIDLDTALDVNIQKLSTRYPQKFTSEQALNRDLEKEREVLDQGAIADRNPPEGYRFMESSPTNPQPIKVVHSVQPIEYKGSEIIAGTD